MQMKHPYMNINPNRIGLIFNDADWVENFVLNEIENEYTFEDLRLTSKDKVIDIGGHTGVVSMYLAKKFGCSVKTYEPSPRNFNLLVKNIKSNNLGNLITPYELAVTGDGRDVKIGDNPLNWGANNIYGNGLNVKSVTLKEILTEPIRLLKIDCEGAEFEIMQDLEPLRFAQSIRGEFHSSEVGDVETLLKRVKEIVPDTQVSMNYLWKVRTQHLEQIRNKTTLNNTGASSRQGEYMYLKPNPTD